VIHWASVFLSHGLLFNKFTFKRDDDNNDDDDNNNNMILILWRNYVVKKVSACMVSEIVPVCLHFMNSYLVISGTF